MMVKKAQAALEYLTTYGWALLALLAIIASLSYFGFNDIQNEIPSSCVFGSDFACNSYVGVDNGSFGFALKNMQRTTINVTGVKCSWYDVEWSQSFNPTSIAVGNTGVFYCNSSMAPDSIADSGKVKYDATVYFYYDEAEALPRAQSGTIIVDVVKQGASVVDDYIVQAIPIQ